MEQKNRGRLIDYAELQVMTGHSYRYIRKRLEAAGISPAGDHGKSIRFDSAAALRAIYTEAHGDPGTLQLDQERAFLAREQTRRLQRLNDLEDGKIAPVEIITDVLQAVARQIVAKLESLPADMKRQNPTLTGHDITLVQKCIARCRNDIANMKYSDLGLNDPNPTGEVQS